MSTIRDEIIEKLSKLLQPYSKKGTQCDTDTICEIHQLIVDMLFQYELYDLVDDYKVNVESHSRHCITANVDIVIDKVETTIECVMNITQPTTEDAFARAMKGI